MWLLLLCIRFCCCAYSYASISYSKSLSLSRLMLLSVLWWLGAVCSRLAEVGVSVGVGFGFGRWNRRRCLSLSCLI